MKILKILALAGIVVAAGSLQAKAALIEFTGTEIVEVDGIPTNFDLNSETGLATGDAVSVYTGGGLHVTHDAILTFTYLGYEAGFQNKFIYDGELLFTTREVNNDGSASPIPSVREFVYDLSENPGPLSFSFWSGEAFGDNTPSNSGAGVFNTNGSYGTSAYSIGFAALTDNSVLLLFGDGNNTNRDNDYDDMAVLLEVTAVPLPPSAILFGTALLGIAGLRMRKKKTA